MKTKAITFGSMVVLALSAELLIAGGMLMHDVMVNVLNDLAAKSRERKQRKNRSEEDD